MAPERVGLCEAQPADGALVGSFPGVHAVVVGQLARLAEAARAEWAAEGPQARMDVAVPPQVAGPLEGLATILALVRLQLRVRDAVAFQVGEVGEGPQAHGAEVRGLLRAGALGRACR